MLSLIEHDAKDHGNDDDDDDDDEDDDNYMRETYHCYDQT